MSITFLTRPAGRGTPGSPVRARPCGCDHGPLITEPEETCVLCGHYDNATIETTWRRPAQAHARRRSRRPGEMAA